MALPEANAMTIDEVWLHFQNEDKLASRLEIVRRVGLGYLVWKQKAFTLSGGEVQRLKIAKELMKKTKNKTLYFDKDGSGSGSAVAIAKMGNGVTLKNTDIVVV